MEAVRLITDTRDEIPENVPALVFGQLVKRAQNVMEQNQSDLYHDAAWLSLHLEPYWAFYWGVNEFGTYIGDQHSDQGKNTYRVKVIQDTNDTWYALFEEV